MARGPRRATAPDRPGRAPGSRAASCGTTPPLPGFRRPRRADRQPGSTPSRRAPSRPTDGPLLILAGAGSGKTRVLAHRVAYLIGVKGVRPWQILAVTFTNRAAAELRERIIGLVGDAGRDVQAGTFHALCARVLRRDGEAIGIDRRFVIYDTDDQQQLMKQILREEDMPATGEYRPVDRARARSAARRTTCSIRRHSTRSPPTGYDRTIAQARAALPARLRAAGALDFDDLLIEAVRLFEEAPDVLARYQDRWRYLHVDEYQDTNRPQYLWVRALAAKHRNLCVVGDDDQSIYSWRGADIRNILDFERDYPDATVVKLEQNYRSHAADPRRRARGRVAQRGTEGQEALDGERRRAADPAVRGVRRGRGGRVDRAPGRRTGGRQGLAADAPRGRRGRRASGPRTSR